MARRVKFLAVAALVLVGPAAGAAYAQTRADPPVSLAAEIAAAKRDGIPTTASELRRAMPATSRNAAPLYEKLKSLLRAKPLAGDAWFAGNFSGAYGYPPDRIAQIERGVSQRPDVTMLVNAAAARPLCVYAGERTGALYDLYRVPTTASAAARWLSAESAAELYQRKPLDAVRAQALGFRPAAHFMSGGGLTSALSANACNAIALRGLERILYRSGSDPAVCKAVRAAVRDRMPDVDLPRIFGRETAIFIAGSAGTRKGGPAAVQRIWSWLPKGTRMLPGDPKAQMAAWDRNEAIMVWAMRRLVPATRLPVPAMLRSLQSLSREVTAQLSNVGYAVAATDIPVYTESVERIVDVEALRPVLACAAAVLAWKDVHGHYPKALSQAVRPVPADPFDGKPLRYRVEGAGFVVYSVGASGSFDGGSEKVRPNASEALFRYPLPAYGIPNFSGIHAPQR